MVGEESWNKHHDKAKFHLHSDFKNKNEVRIESEASVMCFANEVVGEIL